MGSAYHRVDRLATHPAFCLRLGCLVCPLCEDEPFLTMSVADYHAHFFAHSPSAEQAYRWVSGVEFVRRAGSHPEWPSVAELHAATGD